jgi:hypothetical protein
MPAAPPALLRDRARALRATARRLDESTFHRLSADAGDDTWIGPTATTCRSELVRASSDLRDVAQQLRNAARALEQQATDLVGQPVLPG